MIIFLNGTSSSGKSSIVEKLCDLSPDPYFLFSVDRFLEQSMPVKINFEIPGHLALIEKTISGFNKSLGQIASNVDFMIVDHVLQHREWLEEVATSLHGFPVFFVGVRAPLEVIETREAARKNRKAGTAREQLPKMKDYEYDLVVQTDQLSPEEAAVSIFKNLRVVDALSKYRQPLLART